MVCVGNWVDIWVGSGAGVLVEAADGITVFTGVKSMGADESVG
jgi:hypothetical protein